MGWYHSVIEEKDGEGVIEGGNWVVPEGSLKEGMG